ncbi:helix-turn-helix domain-containing protein [Paenibacillus cymbidii]|uniref:helix-turn-helix domain-containing protein n=1 Tax=Paenibacillus cymbidii TaxID=1639034 RepID=UPI0010804D83|nr:helix-turn-helix domain-containing protein [Paenibacillus cymbidii]
MEHVESVQRAIDHIEAHLGEELELARLAEASYTSVAQLYRLFYALTGHPVKEYIRKRRMSVAANHLRNSNVSVEELAWAYGFESYHSFAKVFKKIVGLTPAAYRQAELFFSFEPIRLREQVAYWEDREQSARFPDVSVIRLLPMNVYACLHVAQQEEGMERDAFRSVSDKLAASGVSPAANSRIFGHNVDLPDEPEQRRYGYRILVALEQGSIADETFAAEMFPGGLYAVRKMAAQADHETIQAGWDRLLAEWLPKSTFDLGPHQYIEEFIAYRGRLTRMHLFLPVQRRTFHEPIEVVERPEALVCFCRGNGSDAQRLAERQLIEWHERHAGRRNRSTDERYYMSYAYGAKGDDYWWENGIILPGADSGPPDIASKRFGAGTYVCCITKTYGLLTGVLERMYRWIAASGKYRLDDERQWFAEYRVRPGMDVERDASVTIWIPIATEA